MCASQVRLLYGPLLACVTASKSAFTAMVRQHGNGDIETFVRAARSNPEGREGQIYRCELGPCHTTWRSYISKLAGFGLEERGGTWRGAKGSYTGASLLNCYGSGYLGV